MCIFFQLTNILTTGYRKVRKVIIAHSRTLYNDINDIIEYFFRSTNSPLPNSIDLFNPGGEHFPVKLIFASFTEINLHYIT